jgi:hypothetical protein
MSSSITAQDLLTTPGASPALLIDCNLRSFGTDSSELHPLDHSRNIRDELVAQGKVNSNHSLRFSWQEKTKKL